MLFSRLVCGGVRRFSSKAGEKKWPSTCIIGVGQLGAAVAGNLLRNKVPLVLYDLKRDANVPVALKDSLAGAQWANSAAEAAAASQVVITALPRPEHVTSAFHSKGGILEGFKKGTVWIEHSTTDFENTLKLKKDVEAKGGKCVEAPLTGGMQLLRAGKMVTLVGAEPEVFEGEIASLIALSAPRIVRCGKFGHATIIKIYSNILCAVQDAAVGEALCVAKKAGVDMKLMFDAMRVSAGNSFCWETEVPLALKGNYYPDFTSAMMAKDISLGLELAEKYKVPQPIIQHTMDIYKECMEKYGEDSGSTIPVKLIEDKSGVCLSEGPGNAKDAFKDWTYTAEITNGAFQVLQVNTDNPYLREPYTLHADKPKKS